jgi:hypothetical protein
MMTETQKAAHEEWQRLVKLNEHSPAHLFQILTTITLSLGYLNDKFNDLLTLTQQQVDLLRRIQSEGEK